jgi:multisubunit Na+/H+ antiporter MnhG subunit
VRDAAVAILVGGGVALLVLSCAGVVLLRDPLDRVHATAPSGLAALLVAAGVLVGRGASLIAIKGGLLALLLALTAPVLTHAVAVAVHEDRR